MATFLLRSWLMLGRRWVWIVAACALLGSCDLNPHVDVPSLTGGNKDHRPGTADAGAFGGGSSTGGKNQGGNAGGAAGILIPGTGGVPIGGAPASGGAAPASGGAGNQGGSIGTADAGPLPPADGGVTDAGGDGAVSPEAGDAARSGGDGASK